MWNIYLKFWFLRNCLLQRFEICAIGFGMPQTLNVHHSSHFDAFFQSKINKMWNLWLFARHTLTKMKNMSICTGKSVWKGLKICMYRFLGMPITMHYVRTLCDEYFLSYDGFLLVFHRKDLCKAKHEIQSVFKFSDVLFALRSEEPPSRGI